MDITSILVILIMFDCGSSMKKQCSNARTPLGSLRKTRYLTFPDKTDVVLTISLVKAFMTHAPSGWNIAVEIDVLYPLPDATATNAFFRRKLYHKQKREFWEKLQVAIDFHNMNGRSCILRSICEVKSYLAPPGKSLVHDLLRAIFTAPLHEEDFKEEMKGTYNELSDPNFCDALNDCPFSILDFVLALNKPN